MTVKYILLTLLVGSLLWAAYAAFTPRELGEEDVLEQIAPKDRTLEIYTPENIIYVNVDKLEVSSEVEDWTLQAEDWADLKEIISQITAQESLASYIKYDDLSGYADYSDLIDSKRK